MDGRIYGFNQFRGPPSPEIDEAWRKVSMGKFATTFHEGSTVLISSLGVPGVRVYENELQVLNRSIGARKYHKLPEKNGGGFLAMLEVFHLLHCLVSAN